MATRKGLMDSLDPMARPFGSESTFSDQMEEDQAQQSPESLRDRLAKKQEELDNVNEAIDSVMGAVKASDKPNSLLLDKLFEFRAKKKSLEEEIKQAGPTTPASPKLGEPSVGGQPPNLDLMVGKEGPKTLSESMAQGSKTAAGPATSLKDRINGGAAKQPDYFQQAEAARTAGETSLKDKLAEAEAQRTSARERADIGQAAEMFGKALTQYGAARAGMKSGRDLSQAVAGAPGVDWEARRKEIQQDYQLRQADVENQRKTLAERIDRLDKMGQFEESKKLQQQKLDLDREELKQKTKFQNAEMEVARSKLEANKKVLTPEQYGLAKNNIEAYDKAFKEYNEGNQVFDKLEIAKNSYLDAVKKGSDVEKQYAAIQMIMLANKAQDPPSTIREAEYDRYAKEGNIADLIDYAKKKGALSSTIEKLEQLATKTPLSQGQVEGLYNVASQQKQAFIVPFTEKLQRIRQTENQHGLKDYTPINPKYEAWLESTEPKQKQPMQQQPQQATSLGGINLIGNYKTGAEVLAAAGKGK